MEVRRPFVLRRLREVTDDFLFAGFSAESLGLLRLCLGIALVPFHVVQFESLLQLDPNGPAFHYIEPIWYFELLGIERHVPELTIPVFVGLVVFTLTMAAGKWTRTSILLVILGIFYLKGVRDSFSGDVHHRYLVAVHVLFLLLVSRCGARYSLDARRRDGLLPVEPWQASWPIRAAQLYCVFFYLWSGIAKIRIAGWEWVADGARIQELLLKRSLMWGLTETGEPVGNWLGYQLSQHPTACFLLGLSTWVFELGFPVILLLRRDRWRLAFLAGITFFHVATLVVAYVAFVLQPIVFLVFFDLEMVRQRLAARRSARLTPSPT